MKHTDREFKESPLYQGEDEKIAYSLTTTPWVSSPTSPATKIFRVSGGTKTDTTATNLNGSTTAVGDVITTPLVQSLIAGAEYRLEISWSVSTSLYEAWGTIVGQV